MPNTESPQNPFTREILEIYNQETPFFLFSKERLLAKYKEFEESFPGAAIHYAMKANAEPEILRELFDAGAHFEVASVYELETLKEVGVPGERIVYGTSVKPPFHIREFAAYGVDRFAFDSFLELEKIAALVPGARVYARISVDDTGSVFKFSEKFGTAKENALPMLERARELGLVPYGISFHVGSQAGNERAWAEAIALLRPTLEKLLEADIKLEVIDIGGGFPCNKYTSTENDFTLQEIAAHTLQEYKNLPYQPKLLLEPGRAIVAETGILVTNVIARIERREHTWLFLDAGVYSGLFESMVYQGSTRYRTTLLRPSFDVGEAPFALAGPTGDSPDVITREVFLPADVAIGDKLIIHDVGAYSLVATCPFNGFPKPKVYFI
ncbi:MAG TPA: type III PLP-dependent enzyme [Candidatus Paceibacterota bacterium]|nr:type III PLP-dependent enzyme [Candidatus Paceibacterota bacterium]